MNGHSVSLDNILKIGQLVKLVIKENDQRIERVGADGSEGGEVLVYGTRIEDLPSDSLVVSWPTDQGVHVPAYVGQSVLLEIKCHHGVLCLDSRISAARMSPLPVLHIERGGDWSRSQLRNNVRLDVTITPGMTELLPFNAEDFPVNGGSNGNHGKIDVLALKKMEASSEVRSQPFRALIRDLSAGGVLMITSVRLEKGSIIRTRFPLGKGQPEISVLAQVVRSSDGELGNKEYPHRAGCKFLDLNSRDEDNIIRFIFARQAELRRSGML